MSKYEDFKYVIANSDINTLPEIIPRDISIPLNVKQIITIIGPRRSGKTFLMFETIKKLLKSVNKSNILYINFEHERLRNVKALDLKDMFKAFYEPCSPTQDSLIYLFLDEIQNVEEWSVWLRRIQDTGKFRIYVSGSSSKLLSREIATELRGRSIEFIVLPFSFQEFIALKAYNIDNIKILSYKEEHGKLLRILKEYMELGGYPEVVLETNDMIRNKILESYHNTIIYKDIAERSRIKSVSMIETFMDFAISYYSKYLSMTKIYNYLRGIGYKIRKQSLFDILKTAQDAFVLFPIEIFSHKAKIESSILKRYMLLIVV